MRDAPCALRVLAGGCQLDSELEQTQIDVAQFFFGSSRGVRCLGYGRLVCRSGQHESGSVSLEVEVHAGCEGFGKLLVVCVTRRRGWFIAGCWNRTAAWSHSSWQTNDRCGLEAP
jgi:hypothetical protein